MSHSGSTLLDLLLGCNKSIISLGEINPTINRIDETQKNCTCGKDTNDCMIWGELKRKLKELDGYSIADAYTKLISIVDDAYGNEIIITDSSKSLKSLDSLLKNINQEKIYVLFLIKDVRSYTISQMNRGKRKNKRKKDGWKGIITFSMPYNIVSWYVLNRQMKNFLIKKNFNYLQVGYEELCFEPERILKKISTFLEIEYDSNMLLPFKSKSHMLMGNRMRRDKNELKAIKYDYQWLVSKKLLWLNWLYMPFIGFNNREVYSNRHLLKLKKG